MPRRKNNVVSLHGSALPTPKRDPEVIQWLENMLAEARGGGIKGVVYGLVRPEGHIATGWVGKAKSHEMVAATSLLSHRVNHATVEGDE